MHTFPLAVIVLTCVCLYVYVCACVYVYVCMRAPTRECAHA